MLKLGAGWTWIASFQGYHSIQEKDGAGLDQGGVHEAKKENGFASPMEIRLGETLGTRGKEDFEVPGCRAGIGTILGYSRRGPLLGE